MRKNYIIFNDFNTMDYFLIEDLQEVPTAEEKVDFIEIDGRDGYLTQSQDALKPIDYEVQLNLYEKEDIQKVKNIFRGSGKLILSNDKDKFYNARVVNTITFKRVSFQYYTCVVCFKLQPYAYEVQNKTITIDATQTTKQYTFENNTNTTCEPTITLEGTGNCVLNIGTNQINITDIQNSITLNFAMQEAYKGTANMNTHVRGDFSKLKVGNTTIKWNGSGVTRIIINPNYRWR